MVVESEFPPFQFFCGVNGVLLSIVRCIANSSSVHFLFRSKDSISHRPRINKLNSIKDSEQKASGDYFFMDD